MTGARTFSSTRSTRAFCRALTFTRTRRASPISRATWTTLRYISLQQGFFHPEGSALSGRLADHARAAPIHEFHIATVDLTGSSLRRGQQWSGIRARFSTAFTPTRASVSSGACSTCRSSRSRRRSTASGRPMCVIGGSAVQFEVTNSAVGDTPAEWPFCRTHCQIRAAAARDFSFSSSCVFPNTTSGLSTNMSVSFRTSWAFPCGPR